MFWQASDPASVFFQYSIARCCWLADTKNGHIEPDAVLNEQTPAQKHLPIYLQVVDRLIPIKQKVPFNRY